MSTQDLYDHLATGLTQTCQCWAITRRDGVVFGFTDHDMPLAFDGITFDADSGMSAKALSSTTGLAVDNTEAVGALSAARITEADIMAGRYDGAEVTIWQVRWDEPGARAVRFRGSLGEISRDGAAFRAELRGLSEGLNQPQGRSYLKTCSAVLGDKRCGVDVTGDFRYVALSVVSVPSDGQTVTCTLSSPFNAQWFEGGLIEVLTGAAVGLQGIIKRDSAVGAGREILLWQPIGAEIAVGDEIRLVAGCDKRAETCGVKFENLLNFQGFPHIPGDDWLISVPRSAGDNDGGSLGS